MEVDQTAHQILSSLAVELPSWGFSNTGTRFGKFIQAGAATTIEEKLSDAAFVHELMGCCPSVAVHTAWDFPGGLADAPRIAEMARLKGIRIGSINPTLFESQEFKFGSLGNPDPAIRETAVAHLFESLEIARKVDSREIVLWLADGSNHPGSANIRRRKSWIEEALSRIARELRPEETLLIEYKPFEPAFYHTDIADWGMALCLARKAGDGAKVLVDTGHHYHSQNIEQIVAWLLSEQILGGFHFNDRKYADDDLTVGSIDPYQLFRIFHEILYYAWDSGRSPRVSYMVDQSHNLKNKMEEMVQTVETVQEILLKAALVDHESLALHQSRCQIIEAEECLRRAFRTDTLPIIREWRLAERLPKDPLDALRESGYLERIQSERGARNRASSSGYVQA